MERWRSLGVGLEDEYIGKGVRFDDEDTGIGHVSRVFLHLE